MPKLEEKKKDEYIYIVLCEFLLCFSIFNGSKNCNKMDSKYTLIAYIGNLIISYFFP